MRMRRHIRTTAVAAVALLGLSACSDNILNVTPKDQLSDQAVFTDANLASAFLSDIYRGLNHGLNEMQMSSVSDEAIFTHERGTLDVVMSNVTSSNLAALGNGSYFSAYLWSPMYSRIRQTNIFLSQIDGAKFPEATKNRMKGEALFLRAFFYHNLMRYYGGVPLITKVYGLNEEYEAPRNTLKETIDFIVKDADAAAALLPATYSAADQGRATKGAAMALKARVLLYAASPLYHRAGATPETGLTEAADWRAAKNAAKAVMDLGTYSLFRDTPASQAEAAKNYEELFLQKTSSEVILSRFFLKQRDDGYHPGLHNGPNGYHNWAGNTPIQNLVDDYRMADGSKFDWNNPAHAAAPYDNREPRFYATILYDGAKWRDRPSDVQKLDPDGIIQTFRTVTLPDGKTAAGVDTRKSAVEDWNGSYTGYYLRKFIDKNVNAQFDKQEVPWIFMRYAEILLNYAEASIELGGADLPDAVDALNKIRTRAGMPPLSVAMGQAALREEYRMERRLEMAFEEQRFFDVRRWMIAPTVMNVGAYGIDITGNATDAAKRSTYSNFKYAKTKDPVQTRKWNDKMYFVPIHRDELNRNPALQGHQNPGY